MKPALHILATVRNAELLKAALLVFCTLRVGFPSNPVWVWGNALDHESAQAVQAACAAAGAQFRNCPATSHDAWIEQFIGKFNEPFWICDTDVVFFAPMQPPRIGSRLFSGRYEPEFNEEFTDTIHVERLHTAVMWFNPVPLRNFIRTWQAKIPNPWRASAQFTLIRQNFVPVFDGPTKFYDTTAGLFHAFEGTPFNDDQNGAFEHLHCATYADEVVKGAPSLKDLQSVHEMIYANPALARGLNQQQTAYYTSRQ